MKEILRIEIPNYITHVNLCDSREEKFYTRCSRIPFRYRNENYSFSPYGILVNRRTGKEVLANPKTAGKALIKKIDGQEFYHDKLKTSVRARILTEMKAFYGKYIPQTRKAIKCCKLRLEIHNTEEKGYEDINNMSWIMVRVIQDALSETGILPGNASKVIAGYEVGLVTIESEQERKVVLSLLHQSEQI